MENFPLLIDVLPTLSNRIKDYFISKSEFELANQVDNLQIKGLCECGDPDCGSFYLSQNVDNEDKLEFFSFEGIGTIEVYKGKIGFIEVFPSSEGYQIRSILKKEGFSY
ncbi:hypothetical protein AN964_22805 [Heyndrickxia shackletonii]|uniref:Uncharacterized protein n=1 Tax=Heyndrickxia shackletonii TaxID=157838 RepID=A0A0Q3WRR1_9BACI|nr:hypothetical protein [Heyndrickxia shackletonii]KQL50490.1 hypothetical protein AN964_22805 [Heyndrickxia shackletonii]NEZ01514.1 hypothetical protein [Heyndrickxia shackletonii]